jgi:hypothetical protein
MSKVDLNTIDEMEKLADVIHRRYRIAVCECNNWCVAAQRLLSVIYAIGHRSIIVSPYGSYTYKVLVVENVNHKFELKLYDSSSTYIGVISIGDSKFDLTSNRTVRLMLVSLYNELEKMYCTSNDK